MDAAVYSEYQQTFGITKPLKGGVGLMQGFGTKQHSQL